MILESLVGRGEVCVCGGAGQGTLSHILCRNDCRHKRAIHLVARLHSAGEQLDRNK